MHEQIAKMHAAVQSVGYLQQGSSKSNLSISGRCALANRAPNFEAEYVRAQVTAR